MRKWIVTFTVSSLLSVAVVLFALWAFNGFNGLGIGLWGTLAMVGGVAVTVALGVGLMGLVFASDRSNKDEEVFHAEKTLH